MRPHFVAALSIACAPMAIAANAPPDVAAPKADLSAPVPPPPSLKIGPPPKWVLPAVIPMPKLEADGALQVLLSDNQNFLGPDGDETYSHSAVRILNESGLSAMGTLQQSWNPETDVLTLHAIRI